MRASVAACGLLCALAVACANVAPRDPVSPDFDHDVRPLLDARCARCHGGDAPAARWNASRFTDVIACLAPSPDGGVSPDGGASIQWATRLRAALQRPDHAGFLDDASRAVLTSWIGHGAPASRGALHPAGFADPRSNDFHARALRSSRWAPMLDPSRPDACGRCHDGAPTRPPGARFAARNAPSCTLCHTESQGALACGTCHGSAEQPFPPRDSCLHPGAVTDAHAAHVRGGALGVGPLACETCHPARGPESIGRGAHGDGTVDVVFDPVRAGAGASYDPATRTCTVACHNHGGARAVPAWTDRAPMGCGDCHRAPPDRHPPGPCTPCHREANATGTALTRGPFHFNGRVDLGDGSGTCSACHGVGPEGWPATGSHTAHRAPTGGAAVACGDCHAVPTTVTAEGHLDPTPGAEVRFSGRAIARGAIASLTADGCAGVACHGAGLSGVSSSTPRWGDTSGTARRCGACHALPPAAPHPPQQNCESSLCHGGEVSPSPEGPAITAEGRVRHINGAVDVAGGVR